MPKNETDYGKLSVDALNRGVLEEDEKMKRDGEALSAGTYAIYNKHDLTFAIPRVDYASDRAKAKAYVESRAKNLGLWDERMDGTWWRDNK